MRDSLIGLSFIAAIVGGYWFLNRKPNSDWTLQPSASHLTLQDSQIAKSRAEGSSPHAFTSLNHKPKHKRGALAYESTYHRKHSKIAKHGYHSGESERAAVESAEAESLPSLYSQSSEQAARPEGAAKSAKHPVAKEVIHGVPVAAWLESRKNSLPLPPVSEQAPDQWRLFVQCMEMKKDGPQALSDRDCRALVARTPGQDELAGRGGLIGTY